MFLSTVSPIFMVILLIICAFIQIVPPITEDNNFVNIIVKLLLSSWHLTARVLHQETNWTYFTFSAESSLA